MNTARLAAALCLGSGLLLSALQAAPAAGSKVWPLSDEGTAWLIENLPNAANLGYPVDDKAPAELPPGYTAVVEVPAYIELFSSTLAYSREMPKPRAEAITRDGRPYRRYTFGPLARRNYERWASFFTHWRPTPDAADRQAPGVFAWHVETPAGPEPVQTVPIRLLPELLPLTPLKRLHVRLWQSSIGNVEPAKLREVLVLLQRSGFNQVPWWESTVDNLRQAGAGELGLKIAADQSGHAGWPEMATSSPAPDYQNRDRQGRDLKDQDPQWVIDGDGAPWQQDLDYCRRHAARVDVLSQDVEWNVGGFDTGFSPAAIRTFAKAFSLDAATLTPPTIWKDHRRQWYDFRAAQTLALVSYYYRAAKQGNPAAPFVFLPGSPYATAEPQMLSEMIELAPDNLGRMVYLIFPFPLKRMAEAMDVVAPMWYGHGVSQCREALAWSRAITPRIPVPLVPLFLGQGREFYYPGGDPGEVLRATAWAAVLGGAKGWGYWLGEFSPLQLSWLGRTARELAPVEGILLDGTPDPEGVTVTPLPKRRFTLVSGQKERTFNVPDFGQVALWRAYGQGPRRLVGVINLDPGLDLYYRLAVSGLPAGAYRVTDLAGNEAVSAADGQTSFAAAALATGLVLRTPARYGVSVYLVAPETEAPAGVTVTRPQAETQAAYARYQEPDSTGAVLAERTGLTIRYDLVGRDGATAILLESPLQQVWVRLQDGGRVSDWKIKEGARTIVAWQPPYGGAAADLFWSPSDAHWTGDEISAYDLVDAKIHGGKAYLRVRQKKQTPSLQGVVVTKTIVVPADRTDIEVRVEIENPGPAPEVGMAPWSHHAFLAGGDELQKSEPRRYPQVFMCGEGGVVEAPLKEIVWAKPGQPFLPGNESWEKSGRNGVVTADWIAQRNPVTGEALLCQVDAPTVAQFYSWRDATNPDDLSIEWMYPYVRLSAGQTWGTAYVIRYLKSADPAQLGKRLLPPTQQDGDRSRATGPTGETLGAGHQD